MNGGNSALETECLPAGTQDILPASRVGRLPVHRNTKRPRSTAAYCCTKPAWKDAPASTPAIIQPSRKEKQKKHKRMKKEKLQAAWGYRTILGNPSDFVRLWNYAQRGTHVAQDALLAQSDTVALQSLHLLARGRPSLSVVTAACDQGGPGTNVRQALRAGVAGRQVFRALAADWEGQGGHGGPKHAARLRVRLWCAAVVLARYRAGFRRGTRWWLGTHTST